MAVSKLVRRKTKIKIKYALDEFRIRHMAVVWTFQDRRQSARRAIREAKKWRDYCILHGE